METLPIIAQKDAQIAKLTALHLSSEKTNEQLQKKLILLQDQIAQFQRMIYGRKSERFVPIPQDYPNLFSHLEQNLIVAEQVEKKKIIKAHERKTSKHKGRQLLANCRHLPVEEISIDTPHSPDSIHIGDLIREKLAYKPGKFYIKRYITPKFKETQTGKIVVGPSVVEPIPKCEADISLLTYVVVSKFVDHLPEYRLQKIFKRDQVVIPPSTMNGWTHKIASLLRPMHHHLQNKILNSGYVQMDESTIRVMAGKKIKTHQGYMWVIYSPPYRCVCYIYHHGRSKAAPLEILNNYHGKLQSDGYQVYESINQARSNIDLSNCNAHARRYFEKALSNDKEKAGYAMSMYQQLYAIESKIRKHKQDNPSLDDPTQYYAYRKKARKEAIPIAKAFKVWMESHLLKVTPASLMGKAIAYTNKRWDKLTKYLKDGELEIDNNLIENSIRPLALGRKNFLFAGSSDAAANIGVFYSIFVSCKHLKINPSNYLSWYLQNIDNTKINQIEKLNPWNYKNRNL